MPVLYLMLAFHAALLAPADYWTQPVGALMAVLLAVGVYGALHSLLNRIGRSRKVHGEIVAIEQPAQDVTTVRCRLSQGWHGHRPGQFAFVTFDDKEGAHPFTIASADQGNQTISFQIKALGDYTGQLGRRLQVGQTVRVEGPYGRFDMARINRRARQIWIAGASVSRPFWPGWSHCRPIRKRRPPPICTTAPATKPPMCLSLGCKRFAQHFRVFNSTSTVHAREAP